MAEIRALPLRDAEILLVEDDALLRKRLGSFLERAGASVTPTGTLAEARRCLASLPFDYALIDINLPDGESLSLLRDGAFSQNTGVVIMTAEGGVKLAVEAMKLGAGDYLSKPFDPEELPLVFSRLKRATQSARLGEHERQSRIESSFFFDASMAAIKAQLERIIAADKRLGEGLPAVLIEGETGTGKTAIARWLHHNGPRAGAALVEVNCSALPENLVESELFGHERGAFTDARSARLGLFEAASGGTLFLDEVNSLALPVQAKLLTAIEDRKIRRVGANKPIAVDVRIIAASNKDIRPLVQSGAFREDLFHRLDLLRIRLPALRERGDAIVALANHLLTGLARRYRVKGATIDADGRQRLLAYPWPGNVRELAHEIERSLILGGESALSFAHLPLGLVEGAAAHSVNQKSTDWLNPAYQFPPEGFNLETATNRLVQQAVDQAEGNVSAAARLLGVSRDTVRYRLNLRKQEGLQ
ncbi:MAG: sigma-54 dependent transcriptional regulator [Verrucomicrobiota bacterium]|nr:sigma-54 dependent transcriptional regulator [Verrucomicrobiota bacterium]